MSGHQDRDAGAGIDPDVAHLVQLNGGVESPVRESGLPSSSTLMHRPTNRIWTNDIYQPR